VLEWTTSEALFFIGSSFSAFLERAKVLTATACWFTPIVPGRQSYRAVKLKIDEKERMFEAALKFLGAKRSKDQHASQQTHGTIVHRRWGGRSVAKFQNGGLIEIKVSRMWDDQEDQVPEVPLR
jgi:hypothetical protein